MTCAEAGCTRGAEKRGLCNACYQRRRRAGTLPPLHCPIPDCVNEPYRQGPCQAHRHEFSSAGMKWCTKSGCKNPLKPITDFNNDPNSLDGSRPWCRACANAYLTERYQQGTNALRQSEYYAKRRLENPGFHHGLSDEAYWQMWATQQGECTICSKTLDHNGGEAVKPHVDHDHAHGCGTTGCATCVRSLLCKGCNSMLARAHDDLVILHRWKPTKAYPQSRIDAAIAYLEYWHTEMIKRGVRPSPEDALWKDVFAAATRLVLEIAPS